MVRNCGAADTGLSDHEIGAFADKLWDYEMAGCHGSDDWSPVSTATERGSNDHEPSISEEQFKRKVRNCTTGTDHMLCSPLWFVYS